MLWRRGAIGLGPPLSPGDRDPDPGRGIGSGGKRSGLASDWAWWPRCRQLAQPLGVTLGDPQQGLGRPGRLPPALLPALQGSPRHPEYGRKLRLREPYCIAHRERTGSGKGREDGFRS